MKLVPREDQGGSARSHRRVVVTRQKNDVCSKNTPWTEREAKQRARHRHHSSMYAWEKRMQMQASEMFHVSSLPAEAIFRKK